MRRLRTVVALAVGSGALAVPTVSSAVSEVSAAAVVPVTCDGKRATIIDRSPRANRIVGTPGRDVIVIAAGTGHDIVYGRGGDDVICGRAHTTVFGGRGDDRILYADRAYGGRGDDRMEDVDEAFGGKGDDVLLAAIFNETFAGGSGHDRVEFFSDSGLEGVSYSVRVDLARGIAEVWADDAPTRERLLLSSVEEVRGSGGDDVVLGDDRDNVLRGFSGDDVVDGRGGRDRVYGGTGTDVCTGEVVSGCP